MQNKLYLLLILPLLALPWTLSATQTDDSNDEPRIERFCQLVLMKPFFRDNETASILRANGFTFHELEPNSPAGDFKRRFSFSKDAPLYQIFRWPKSHWLSALAEFIDEYQVEIFFQRLSELTLDTHVQIAPYDVGYRILVSDINTLLEKRNFSHLAKMVLEIYHEGHRGFSDGKFISIMALEYPRKETNFEMLNHQSGVLRSAVDFLQEFYWQKAIPGAIESTIRQMFNENHAAWLAYERGVSASVKLWKNYPHEFSILEEGEQSGLFESLGVVSLYPLDFSRSNLEIESFPEYVASRRQLLIAEIEKCLRSVGILVGNDSH